MAEMPHCDSRILHRDCDYCNKYPAWQLARKMWGINFTGEHDPKKLTCPSELARKLQTIERWPGNIPVKEGEFVGDKPFRWIEKDFWEDYRKEDWSQGRTHG